MPAAQIAVLAQEKGKFWEAHDLLWENMGNLRPTPDDPNRPRETLLSIAQQVGIDRKEAERVLDEGLFKERIQADMDLAKKLEATGTPWFFVNGRSLRGAQPYEKFKEIIDQELSGKVAAVAQEKPAEPPKRVEIPLGGSPWRGKRGAPITIVEFSDFQCVYCKRAVAVMEEVLKVYEGKVRLVFKHHPLAMHKGAMPAAQFAMLAQEKGKFWEAHDLLFRNVSKLRGEVSAVQENLVALAPETGLDPVDVKTVFEEGRYKDAIQRDIDLSAEIGARGTPWFYVNGLEVKGAQPFERFKSVIDQELAELEKGKKRK
jgi:protein-disulfide isomerase